MTTPTKPTEAQRDDEYDNRKLFLTWWRASVKDVGFIKLLGAEKLTASQVVDLQDAIYLSWQAAEAPLLAEIDQLKAQLQTAGGDALREAANWFESSDLALTRADSAAAIRAMIGTAPAAPEPLTATQAQRLPAMTPAEHEALPDWIKNAKPPEVE